MPRKLKHIALIALVGIMAMALWAPAAPAYYVEYVGSRSSADPAQVTGVGKYGAGGNGFQIAWHITQDTPSAAFHYEYTLSGVNGGSLSKTLSHWILEVSAEAVGEDFFNFTPPYSYSPGVRTYNPTGPRGENPGMPSSFYGMKWGSTVDYPLDGYPEANKVYIFSFETFRMPTWGDFYAKDGLDYAYNTGFGLTPVPDGPGFIMVPDTQTVPTPIPASVLLLGSGLMAMGVLSLRKKAVLVKRDWRR